MEENRYIIVDKTTQDIEQFFVSVISEKGIISLERLKEKALTRFNFDPYTVYSEQKAKRMKERTNNFDFYLVKEGRVDFTTKL